MPRQQKVTVENNFIKGLITEKTALQFPKDACTETFNCVFKETGRVTRRLGIDRELGGSSQSITSQTSEAYTEYLWTSVGGEGTRNFVVQQQGQFLFFFDVSETTTVIGTLVGTVDLFDGLVSGSPLNPSFFPCQYAQGRGNLIVVNAAINPLLIKFSSSTGFSVVALTLLQRDFVGLDDGLDVSERPTIDPQDLDDQNPAHLYNLINQGWYVGGENTAGMSDSADILNKWAVSRADSPSNADVPSLYRDTSTATGTPSELPGFSDVFNPDYVDGISTGNTLAPKGHFILDVFNVNRSAALLAEGYTVDLGDTTLITGGSILSIGVASPGNAFDGDTSESSFGCAVLGTSGVLGRSLINSVRVKEAEIYGSNTQGFISSSDPSVTLTLRAKQGSAPTGVGQGTSLGTVTFTDTGDESGGRIITSTDQDTFWDHIWIETNASGTLIAEIRFFTPSESGGSGGSISEEFATIKRPSAVEFFAGRAFYAGVEAFGRNSNVYFTQILERDEQYSQCYQKNDPTNEHFTDLLPDDGGVVKIPDIASVKKLFAYQTSLLVFATNGVWQISGSSQDAFQANDYQVRRLSSVGTQSPLSFVGVKGVPYWWAEDGIYTITFDPNYNSFAVTSITDETIKTFFNNIPKNSGLPVKGAYDRFNNVVQWIYTDPVVVQDYVYNKLLCFNVLSKAFYPWTISTPGTIGGLLEPKIRGILYVTSASQASNNQVIKYTVTGEDSFFLYANSVSVFEDWTVYGLPTEYSSFFVSGYEIEGEGQRFFQPNYVFVYLENEEDASCFMRGVFDTTINPNTGKWSTKQQLYNQNLIDREVNFRKLKVRGKGRFLQLRFESETVKPFTIIGWSQWQTQNSMV